MVGFLLLTLDRTGLEISGALRQTTQEKSKIASELGMMEVLIMPYKIKS